MVLYPEHDFYNEPNYVAAFSNNRFLDNVFTAKYIRILTKNLPYDSMRILDVGSGNGRFAIPLAYCCPNYYIDCIDTSSKMIDALNERILQEKTKNITGVQGDFNKYISNYKYDVILFSESFHLFPNKTLCLQKAVDFLSKDGLIFIRSPLSEKLNTGDMYRYFPEALEIDEVRHISMKNLRKLAKSCNVRIKKTYTVKESTKIKRIQYQKIFEDMIYSTLRLIPPEIYSKRLLELKNQIYHLNLITHSIDMSFIILCQKF